MNGRKRILIAPLDWGLGHATRCIPIISKLLAAGHDVYIAADKHSKTLLEQEFPSLPFLRLEGYNVRYGKNKWGMMVNIFLQIPRILLAIKREREWLQEAVKQYKFDLIISDNRYGLYHSKVFSVFITHQLLIKSPVFQKRLQQINYSFINKFDECWVPDYENVPSLAGSLSHPTHLPSIPVTYVGPLSRFGEENDEIENRYLLVILSGPEPQRTLLEEKILSQLQDYHYPVFLVRGLPGSMDLPKVSPNITVANHLPAGKLEVVIKNAGLVIARSGYSTVMDLMALQKKSILIPTPGQTEQEYLGEHLTKQQFTLCMKQDEFELGAALKKSQSFPYQLMPKPQNDLLGACLAKHLPMQILRELQ